MRLNGIERNMEDIPAEELQRALIACRAALPEHRKFSLFYIDPPIRYDTSTGNREGLCRYPTMSLDDLRNLPIKKMANPLSLCFLWVSGPTLPKGLDLLNAWGFRYLSVFTVWNKVTSQGNPVMGCRSHDSA